MDIRLFFFGAKGTRIERGGKYKHEYPTSPSITMEKSHG